MGTCSMWHHPRWDTHRVGVDDCTFWSYNSQTGIRLTGSVSVSFALFLPPPSPQVIFFSFSHVWGLHLPNVRSFITTSLISFGRNSVLGEGICFGKLHKLSRLHDDAKGKMFYGWQLISYWHPGKINSLIKFSVCQLTAKMLLLLLAFFFSSPIPHSSSSPKTTVWHSQFINSYQFPQGKLQKYYHFLPCLFIV